MYIMVSLPVMVTSSRMSSETKKKEKRGRGWSSRRRKGRRAVDEGPLGARGRR